MNSEHGETGAARWTGWRRWAALALIFGLVVAANALRNSFQFFVPSLEEDLQASRTAVTAAMSVFVVVTGVLAPAAGRLVDRSAPGPVIAGGLALLGLALLTSVTATGVGRFVLGFGVLGGAGFACVVGAPSQVFVTTWFRRNRALAVALMSNAYSAGLLFLAPVWTGLAAGGAGWRSTYTGLGVLLLAVAAPLALLALRLPAHGRATAVPERSLRLGAGRALRSPVLLLLLGALLACGTTMGIVDTHLVPLLHDNGIADPGIAMAMSSLGAMIVAGGLAAGWLSDRLGERHRLLSGLFAMRVAAFALLVAPVGPWRFSAFVVLFGLSYTGVIPVSVAAITETRAVAGLTGSVLGLGMLLHQVGGFAGVYGVAALRDLTGSYALPLACAAVVAGLAAAGTGYAARIAPPTQRRPLSPAAGRRSRARRLRPRRVSSAASRPAPARER